MTTTSTEHPELFRTQVVAHVTVCGPRFAYRHRGSDTWSVVGVTHPIEHWTADNSNWVSQDYSDGMDAIRGLTAPALSFDSANVYDVEDAETRLRTLSVHLYTPIVEFDENGVIADPKPTLDHISFNTGVPMAGQRAVRELSVHNPLPRIPADSLDDNSWLEGSEDPTPGRPILLANLDPIILADGRRYWPRELFGTTDVEVLRQVRSHSHVRLAGPPGAGKTSLAAAAFGEDLITVQGHSDLTVASLYGQYQPAPPGSDTRWVWVDGPLTRAAREGKVLLIDELNRAPKDVDEALLSATDGRRVVILSDRPDLPPVHAATGFMVIATYNDADHGTRRLSAGLLRRLSVPLTVETDLMVACLEGIEPDLLLVAANLRASARAVSGTATWWPQMADLLGAQRMLPLGAQATFAALTASTGDRQRISEAAGVFASVFGADVNGQTRLGPVAC